jgi:hypothetical protein
MDVEGFERYVVEGGMKTLLRFRPKMITEFNKKSLQSYYGIDPESYYDLLRSIFNSIYIIQRDGTLLESTLFSEVSAEITGEKFWVDLLCVPN